MNYPAELKTQTTREKVTTKAEKSRNQKKKAEIKETIKDSSQEKSQERNQLRNTSIIYKNYLEYKNLNESKTSEITEKDKKDRQRTISDLFLAECGRLGYKAYKSPSEIFTQISQILEENLEVLENLEEEAQNNKLSDLMTQVIESSTFSSKKKVEIATQEQTQEPIFTISIGNYKMEKPKGATNETMQDVKIDYGAKMNEINNTNLQRVQAMVQKQLVHV